jgi:hypothetical protein
LQAGHGEGWPFVWLERQGVIYAEAD